MANVGHAIILAGGVGSRMLPASLYSPKEGLPLVDTPLIHHLIWEAARSGVSDLHIVLSERKAKQWRGILSGEEVFSEDKRPDLPSNAMTPFVEDMEIHLHVQKKPGGVGDAINTALEKVEGPFLVLLGDNILIKEHFGPVDSGPENASEASLELVEKFEKSGGVPCVGVLQIEGEEVGKYGTTTLSSQGEDAYVLEIDEKPPASEKDSSYVLCGRYILPSQTKEILDDFSLEEYGEMQSIALLRHLIHSSGLVAVKLDGYKLYDSGDPVSWLKSQIDHAINRKDVGDEMVKWMNDLLGSKEK